jgi:hypothetical protein
VARKQIELATCGLWQSMVKLWKFFWTWTDGIGGHFYVSESVVCEMVTFFSRADDEREHQTGYDATVRCTTN